MVIYARWPARTSIRLRRPKSTGNLPAHPLGVLYRGKCEMGGGADQEICNFGYARGECDAFPPNAEADAVRFAAIAGKFDLYSRKEPLANPPWGCRCVWAAR